MDLCKENVSIQVVYFEPQTMRNNFGVIMIDHITSYMVMCCR